MGRHRLATKRPRIPRHRRPLNIDMVEVESLLAHRLTPDAAAVGRGPGGRYLAVCGAEVIPAALEEPGRGYCQRCRLRGAR